MGITGNKKCVLQTWWTQGCPSKMHGTTQLCHPVSRKMLKLVRMWGAHSEDSELSCFLGTDYNAQRSDKRHPVKKPQRRKRDNRTASDGINATTPPTIHISVASSSAHSSVGYRRIPLRLICPALIRALPLHSKRLQPTLNISNRVRTLGWLCSEAASRFPSSGVDFSGLILLLTKS